MNRAAVVGEAGLRSAFDAALIMVVGMGFGRFAFTAVYPYMINEGLLTLQGGSFAASANYAGYLLGALLAMRLKPHDAHRWSLWSMLGTSACLGILAGVESTAGVVAVRGLAGVCSAFSIVAASLWLLQHRRQTHRAPFLFAGVGIGIAVSAELLAVGSSLGLGSKGLWLLMGAASLLITLVAMPGLVSNQGAAAATQNAASPGVPPVSGRGAGPALGKVPGVPTLRPVCLAVVYGLAGFGYIVTATYLPLLVGIALPNLNAEHVWAIFGLAAVPSCFVWHGLHQRFGTRTALCANLAIQALGVGLPVLLPSAAGYLLSAVLVGTTFMGTVTITMLAAQRIAAQSHASLMAVMAVVYGVGQILGPIVANAMYAASQSLNGSLIAAALALLCGAMLGTRLHR